MGILEKIKDIEFEVRPATAAHWPPVRPRIQACVSQRLTGTTWLVGQMPAADTGVSHVLCADVQDAEKQGRGSGELRAGGASCNRSPGMNALQSVLVPLLCRYLYAGD